MNCRQAQRAVSVRRSEALTPETARRLAAHLDACAPCRDFARALDTALGEVREARRALPIAPVSPSLAHRAVRSWGAAGQQRTPPVERRGSRLPALAALGGAAAVVVAAGAGVMLTQRGGSGLPAQTEEPPTTGPARVARQDAGSPTTGARRTGTRPDVREKETPLPGNRPVRDQGTGPFPGRPSVDSPAAAPRIVRKTPPAAPAGDDLAYINADPAASLGRWARLPEDDTLALAERLRRSVRGGDGEFVFIPFPRVASSDRQAMATAVAAYRREAAVVDARLIRTVSVAAKGEAFADLCERLTAETGVRLRAGRSVADDKVTVFCKDKPLRDLMRQISRLFGFTWERRGEEGAYGYTLTQPLRAQLVEEELRNRDRNEALLALDKEMEQYRRHLDLSPEQAREKARSAGGDAGKVLQALGGPGWGPARLYFGLSGEEMTALRNGQTLRFGSGAGEDWQELPGDVAQGVLESQDSTRVELFANGRGMRVGSKERVPKGIPPVAVPGVRASASLEMDRSELGQFVLKGHAGGRTASGSGWSTQAVLAVGVSPSVRAPRNAEANAHLAGDAGLRRPATIEPRAADKGISGDNEGGGAGSRPAATAAGRRRVTTAEVLEAVHRATGRDVIGDYYTRLHDPEAATVTGAAAMTTFDALNRIADGLHLRWNRDGGWLTFRSAGFFNDRLKEVPNHLLTRWAAGRRRHGGASPLGDLAEMARLTDAQLDSSGMAEGAETLFGLKEWGLVRDQTLRPHWRFLAGFPRTQQEAASSDRGLAFERMPLAQQQQFVALTFGQRPAAEPPSLADLGGSRVRVDYSPPDSRRTPPETPRNASPDRDLVSFTYIYGGSTTGRLAKQIGSQNMKAGAYGPAFERQP